MTLSIYLNAHRFVADVGVYFTVNRNRSGNLNDTLRISDAARGLHNQKARQQYHNSEPEPCVRLQPCDHVTSSDKNSSASHDIFHDRRAEIKTKMERKSLRSIELPLQVSNLDSPDPESGVLPVTPRGKNLSITLYRRTLYDVPRYCRPIVWSSVQPRCVNPCLNRGREMPVSNLTKLATHENSRNSGNSAEPA